MLLSRLLLLLLMSPLMLCYLFDGGGGDGHADIVNTAASVGAAVIKTIVIFIAIPQRRLQKRRTLPVRSSEAKARLVH